MNDRIRTIQTALATQGYDPGPADGIWGRRSIAALRSLQAARRLVPDGIVGPATLAALGLTEPAPPIMWLEEARRLAGTLERPGTASNPAILDWASTLGISYSGDDIAWCGLFVAHCLASTLPTEPLPDRPLAARSWLRCGTATTPALGAIMIFWRSARAGWLGHVGFYVGEDAAAYHILGGNQSDSVRIARIGRDRLLDARWPSSGGSLPREIVQCAAATPISVREA